MATNILTLDGEIVSSWHLLAHLPWYVYGFVLVVILLILALLIKKEAVVELETFFGKIKIPFLSGRNKINACELCKLNIMQLVTEVAESCGEKFRVQQANLNEQLRELDNQFVVDSSWVTNCHAKMVSDKIKVKFPSITDEEKTKIFLKNISILNYLWLIKKQYLHDLIKNIILTNHFVDKNPTELRYFAKEKSRIIIASIQNSPNLYPDWDDSSLLFERQEYVDLMTENTVDRLEDSLRELLERCQVIQRRNNLEAENIDKQKQITINKIIAGLPPIENTRN